MQPIASLITLDKAELKPVYLQLAERLTELIRTGTLQAGHRLPSTRKLSELLKVHRKTVIRAYDELLAQGWLESSAGNGTFVAGNLPEVKPQKLKTSNKEDINPVKTAGFTFEVAPHLVREVSRSTATFHLDDGFPDSRLVPLKDLSRAYRTQLLIGNPYQRLGYSDPKGSIGLRQELSAYLNITRGLQTTAENILVTRGSVMGLYLASTALLQKGDVVVAGTPGWAGADNNFIQAGAELIRIPVDEYGLKIEELEAACKAKRVRLVYVTSHHHYPTTVSLRADRRIHLLSLAKKYGFIVFEDDYDYDFHYENKPLLPLASADRSGMVLYCGSFTKTISPAFRVGYLVGSENVIQHLAGLRRIIDRQGDVVLENAMAELLQNGIIQRHLRKSLRLYRQRRDLFCALLKSELSSYLEFNVPEGGMAVWARFDPMVDLADLVQRAIKKDLYFSNGLLQDSVNKSLNATRLGFASSTERELEQCVGILVELMKEKRF